MYNYEDIEVMDLSEVADELLRMASYRVLTRLENEILPEYDNTIELVNSAIKLYKTIMVTE